MARSSIPAFGLMQIVPGSAGKDVAAFLYGKSVLLSPEYLYQADKNIEAGSVYMYLLQQRYFKQVRQDETRLYLSIASYNTGPGNVAKTLTGSTSLNRAAMAANLLPPKQVYVNYY